MCRLSLAALALAALVLPVAPAAAPGPGAAPRASAPPPGELAAAPEEAGADPPDEEEAPAADAPPPGTRNGVLRNFQVPPPGAPDDVALWVRANGNDLALMAARGEATRLQVLASTSGYAPRLEAAVARGALAPLRADALGARLEEAWLEVARILSARWGIDPTRGCRYAFLAFDNLMELADGPDRAPRLAQARGRLADCTGTAEGILRQLAAASGVLRDALADIDRAAAGGAPTAPR